MTPEQLQAHLRKHSFNHRAAAQGVANRLSTLKAEQHRPVRHDGRWFLQNVVRRILVTLEGEPLLPS